MNAAVYMDSCPPEETLAAFIDERLDAKSRPQVVQHLADCDDCRDLVVAATEYESIGGLVEGDAMLREHLGGSEGVRGVAIPAENDDGRVLAHGGDVTYHEPGQIVDHPMLRLGEGNRDVRKSVPPIEGVAQTGDTVVSGRFGRSRSFVELFAAAAIVALLFGVVATRERLLGRNSSRMDELVEAANSLPKRPTAARLSGDFAYKIHSITRGSEEELAEIRVEATAAEIQERAEKNPTAKNLHEEGVARILLKKQRNEAVAALQRAVEASPSSAEVWTDLSVAYLARGHDGDYQEALTAATTAWEIRPTPAAAWNRALALEYLERGADAKAAWEGYLRLDSNSEWAKEARERIRRLQER